MDIRLEVISKTESRRIHDLGTIPHYIVMIKITFEEHPIEGNFVVNVEEDVWNDLVVGQVLEGSVY